MGGLTEAMLAKLEPAFKIYGILVELSQQHDQVVVLREAVIAYLQQVGRGELSDAEADEHANLVAATGEIENMSAAISRDLAPLARSLKEADLTPSGETAGLLKQLFQTIQQSAALHAGVGGARRTGGENRGQPARSDHTARFRVEPATVGAASPKTTRTAYLSTACSSRCSTSCGASTAWPSTWRSRCCHAAFSLANFVARRVCGSRSRPGTGSG